MNIAFLIIDVQEAFIGHLRDNREYQKTMQCINETASLFRKAEKPVIIIRDIKNGDGEEYKNVKDLTVEENDLKGLKIYSNSFWKTDLEERLQEKGVDFVVICGNVAENCVLATYNGAKERGFGAAMLQHGIFSKHPNGLIDIYNNRDMISYEVLSYFLKQWV